VWFIVGVITLLAIVFLIHNFQETILTPGLIGFVVKIMKQEHKVNDTQPLF
jgi:hypothetical protein